MASMNTAWNADGTQTSRVTTPGLALQDPNDMIRFAYLMAQRRLQQQPSYGGGGGGGGGIARAPVASRPVLGSAPAGIDSELDYAQKRRALIEAQSGAPKPSDFGRENMDKYGNWGTFVDPAGIPADLQDKIMGGQYGRTDNWDSANPSIMGPQQWKTGKYAHLSGSGPRVDPNSQGQAAIDQVQNQTDRSDLIQRYISQGMTPPAYLTGGR